jgi:hypothetical protein
MNRRFLLLFLVFPLAALVRAARGQTQDKAPVIAAVVILVLGLGMVGFLRDWPRLLRFKLKSHPGSPDPGDPRPGQEAGEPAGGMSTIESVRQAVGQPPRVFPDRLHHYLRVRKPNWLWYDLTDALRLPYRYQQRIRDQGKVVWGAVVQANQTLFVPDPIDAPASVIFSEDPWFDDHPTALVRIADALYKLKGTQPADAQRRAFADLLTVETARGMRFPVPTSMSGGRAVYHSSIVLPRKHLPGGRLGDRLLPIFLDPADTGAVLLVPAAYWPRRFLASWAEGEGRRAR